MSALLFSINPEYAARIMDGTKRFEFRKTRCRRETDLALIYCTCPVGRVVGEAHIYNIIEDDPECIWRLTKDAAGVSKRFFDEYYRGRDRAVAYELGDVTPYIPSKKLSEFGVSRAPQSFMYVDR